MFRNPLVTLVIGVVIGLAVGYVLGERQAVPPAPATPPSNQAGMPAGHPPIQGGQGPSQAAASFERRVAELEGLLEASPEDVGLMVQLGNIHYDAERWDAARQWYERALELRPDNPDVLTDLAVVYRSLHLHDESLQALNRAIEVSPDHWQAWYNKVVVLHFDMDRSGEAMEAFRTLEAIAARNPAVPDLSGIENRLKDG